MGAMVCEGQTARGRAATRAARTGRRWHCMCRALKAGLANVSVNFRFVVRLATRLRHGEPLVVSDRTRSRFGEPSSLNARSILTERAAQRHRTKVQSLA